MTASGTGAVESMIASLVPRDGKLLVVQNGVYGERIANIATQYGIEHVVHAGDWMCAPDATAIERRLASEGPFSHVAIVHHETTTGRLNDLRGIGALCRKHGAQLLVDAVSSFGAEAIEFTQAPIAAVAATANKCLHGVPGASFVIATNEAIERAASRTYYLDLSRLARLQAARNTPFTPSVQAYYALAEALHEFEDEGGLSARHARYAALAEQVRSGLAARGITSILPPEQSSVVLRSYSLPQGIAYEPLHDALKARGFVIYAGQGDLSKQLFRISTMGDIAADDIERLLQAFDELVR
jgi:2-aminoethylphosphonate-pyruvate transaminase